MPTPTPAQPDRLTQQTITSEIRDALSRIEDVNRDSNGFLKALALILHRVADADDCVSKVEMRRMESILAEHAGLSGPEALLTVEIARQCRASADCGRAYEASRRLRRALDDAERHRLHGFLESVAEADGTVLPEEKAIIRQIAAELGLLA